MGASKGHKVSANTKSDRAEEEARGVATITGLIHKLYSSDSSSAIMRKQPDEELIEWSKIIGAVRDR